MEEIALEEDLKMGLGVIKEAAGLDSELFWDLLQLYSQFVIVVKFLNAVVPANQTLWPEC